MPKSIELKLLEEEIKRENIALSDKAKIALSYTDDLVIGNQSYSIISSDIIYGLIASNSVIAMSLEEFGLDLADLKSVAKNISKVMTRDKPKLKHQYERGLHIFNKHKDRKNIPLNFPIVNRIIQKPIENEISSLSLFLQNFNLANSWDLFHRNGVSLNKLNKYISSLNIVESNLDNQKLVISIDNNRFKVFPYDLINVSNYSDGINNNEPFKLYTTKIDNFIFLEQIEEFEWLINKVNVSEYDIQNFLEKNPGFLLNIEYKSLVSQVTLERDTLSNLRPDFMLERIDSSFFDILDIKKPNVELVVGSKNRRTFSSHITSALSQLTTYRDYFDNPTYRNNFYNKYGFQAYKPRISVVIGRSRSFINDFERRDLENLIPQLNVLTYDDILLKAKNRALITKI